MTRRFLSVLLVAGALCSRTVLCMGEDPAPTPPASALGAPTEERQFLVSIPPALEPLKRAPVMFRHDMHTAALKTEGCAACHPVVAGRVEFSFPKVRNEKSRSKLTDSYHDACINCHAARSKERKPAGPETCGKCHIEQKVRQQKDYLPIVPDDKGSLRDAYHTDCTACHLKPGKTSKETPSLDWKSFHVQAKRQIEQELPEVVYDYVLHDKHSRALEAKCELCHYIAPALKEKLAAEGRKPSSQDWLREEEPGRSWKQKESAHIRCINCHLALAAEKKKCGPVDCKDCHAAHPPTAAELAAIQPPDYDKKERILIAAEKAALPAVPFNHKAHIAASRSCADCHHKTLNACVTCHTIKGSKDGNFITLAEAYHRAGSTLSCIGCHDREKAKPDCAGCHSQWPGGLAETDCDTCHTGKLESLDRTSRLPDPATLFPEGTKDEFAISILGNEFEPSMVKHRDIARRLTDISNTNNLAAFFHRDETTICAGCHHLVPIEKQKRVPACVSCHTSQNVPTANSPTLLGAYHQQCLGCHKAMGHPEEKMPQSCTGCHKEKKKINERKQKKLS